MSKLFELVHEDLEITDSLIKDLHRIILVEPYEDRQAEIQPGQWRQLPNYLYGKLGERIDFAPPADVPRLMNDLINWLNNHLHPPKRKRKRYDLHPLVIAAGFHQQFIAIHPFGDGNGRMARILTNLILMIAGYVPLIVRTEDREEYFAAINVSDVDESATLAQFFGERLLVSLRLAIKAGKGKDLETMREREAGLRALNDRLTDEP
ncbi:MAG: Fic family protein [Bacteroidota bacterium]